MSIYVLGDVLFTVRDFWGIPRCSQHRECAVLCMYIAT